MATEDVSIDFTPEAIEEVATLAAEINTGIENIGARRLQTVMEKLVEDISFSASERCGETIMITAQDVRTRVGELAKNADLTKFIL
jgi:ATP-dependent HslUV protease ATP-binding subunit HslU